MATKKGRPLEFQDSPMSVYTVRLPAWYAIRARKLGQGNLGNGIRIAIERAVREIQEFDELLQKEDKSK
jgi:hypothetical protein